jgi:hypothetical protein
MTSFYVTSFICQVHVCICNKISMTSFHMTSFIYWCERVNMQVFFDNLLVASWPITSNAQITLTSFLCWPIQTIGSPMLWLPACLRAGEALYSCIIYLGNNTTIQCLARAQAGNHNIGLPMCRRTKFVLDNFFYDKCTCSKASMLAQVHLS